ncbi:MAG: ATP synthase F1 subunit gamma [Clostridia bacterium]|nr:ATP synthase F1 subunit gamma [Clostridia bacterium]
MGTATIKAVRQRINSVNSTMHITKAMQLVASSKMKRAQARLEQSAYFFSAVKEAFADLCERSTEKSVYLQGGKGEQTLCVVIAGDRGLAGGYNNNVFKLLKTVAEQENAIFLPIGKKAVDYCTRHDLPLFDSCPNVERMTAAQCDAFARALTERFAKGEYRKVDLIYTKYHNMLSQEAVEEPLLPAAKAQKTEQSAKRYVCYEPSPEAVMAAVVPVYLSGMLWGAVSEAYASEIAARRTAMDSATKNANEMLNDLSLQYNRARQGAITAEITEIVAGAEPT